MYVQQMCMLVKGCRRERQGAEVLHDGDWPGLTQRGVPSIHRLNSLESFGNLPRYEARMIEEVDSCSTIGNAPYNRTLSL